MFVSDFFHSLLSEFGKSYCRPVDIVTVKGSVNPMILYTVDVDETLLKRNAPKRKSLFSTLKQGATTKERIKEDALKGMFLPITVFEGDDDLATLTKNCKPNADYRKIWKGTF